VKLHFRTLTLELRRESPVVTSESPRDHAAAVRTLSEAHRALDAWAGKTAGQRQFADEVADIFERFVGLPARPPVWPRREQDLPAEPAAPLPELDQPDAKGAADALRAAQDALATWAKETGGPAQFSDEAVDVLRRFVGAAALQPIRPKSSRPADAEGLLVVVVEESGDG